MRSVSGRWLVLLLLVPLLAAAASVRLEVDKRSIVEGDTVTFTITAEGRDVKFPVVKSIGGFPILTTAKKSSISIVNGTVSRSISKSYTFAPMKDVKIPPLEVEVDGKLFETEPVEISVGHIQKQHRNGGDSPSLSLILDKNESRVGEALRMEVLVKYPKDRNYVDVQIQRPEFANFWIKQIGDKEVYDDDGYRVIRYRYLIFPQKAGRFELGPLQATLARRVKIKSPLANDPFFDDDFFGSMFARLERRNIVSGKIAVKVDPLPSGVDLNGLFDIEAEADKTRVEANKPVHVTVKVNGIGNIDDVKKFEPDIPDAVVYADDPKIEAYIQNGEYGGTFTQRITIVADRNFTVPSFEIRYFDPKSKKVVSKRTDPIEIEVVGAVAANKSTSPEHANETLFEGAGKLEKEERAVSAKVGEETRWLYLLTGFAAGAACAYLFLAARGYRRRKKPKEKPLSKRVVAAKSDKELLELLLPYVRQSEVIEAEVRKLEENIYKNGKNRVDKDSIIEELEWLEEEAR